MNHISKSKKKIRMKRKILEFLPVILLVLLIVIFWKKLYAIIIPLLLGALIANMLAPAVDFLYNKISKKFSIKRTTCVAIVFLFFLLVIVLSFSFLIPVILSNVSDILDEAGGFKENLVEYSEKSFLSKNSVLGKRVGEIINQMGEELSGRSEKIIDAASKFSTYGKISQVIIAIVTTAVLAFYILRDQTFFKNIVFGMFPYRYRKLLSGIFLDLGKIFSKFIQGQFLVAIIVGLIEAFGLILLDVPYAMFFGIVGGASNMIPYFGPFIGAVLPVVTAFMISPLKAIWVLVLFLGIQQIDNHFISPKIIQGNLGIHPVTVIVAIFVGERFFGIWGILAAVPVYAMLKCVAIHLLGNKKNTE